MVMSSLEGEKETLPQPPSGGRSRLWWVIGLVVLTAAGVLAAIASQSWDVDKTQGLELAAKGKFGEAEPRLQHALARRPQDVEVIRTLALGYLGVGRNADAEPLLSR